MAVGTALARADGGVYRQAFTGSPVWRAMCGLADQARVRQVPQPGLLAYGPGPLSEEACLDPLCQRDPTRFFPPVSPIRPDVWETVEAADGVEVESLAFQSAAPFGIAVNDRVAVRFYRPAAGRPRYSLLVLHGIWRQDRVFEERLCRDLARNHVSSALLTLPFHWDRAPAGAPSGACFLSGDPVWTSAAFRQAVIDARGVLGLLRGRGVPVGVIGFSLGGIIAHVLMGLEPVDLGVSALAGGDTAGIVWESVLTRSYRRAMEARGVTRERLGALWATGNPTAYARLTRAGKLLMLNALYDRLIPRPFTQELWQALGRPAIRWLPAGHITAFLFRQTIIREVLGVMGLARLVPAPARARPQVMAASRARLAA